MDGLFLAEKQFDEMLAALKEKKNVVLQGAPGVGKTFVAKRLAYALIESNDQRQVEMIQFHQSYPTVDSPLSVDFMDKKHKIKIRTINLDQDWQGIHKDLLALVA